MLHTHLASHESDAGRQMAHGSRLHRNYHGGCCSMPVELLDLLAKPRFALLFTPDFGRLFEHL
jgi:hypothetical protein